MLEVIEKLLVLQDRDRKIHRLSEELLRTGPERQLLQSKAQAAQASLEASKALGKQIESDRKKLELDVDAKKLQIEKYSLQQFQTKKNEEYKALGHQIETCKEDITKLEDTEIELMEQAEAAQKTLAQALREAGEIKKSVDDQLKVMAQRETNLKKELSELQSSRQQLTAQLDEGSLARYERLLKHKGEHVVVGIEHGVCGGCHMQFPVQVLIQCQAQQEIVPCPNCGRILYYTRDMDVEVLD
jgi:uncharacterized protein